MLGEEEVERFAAAALLRHEDAILGDLGEGDVFDCGERVAGGDDHHELVLVNGFEVKARVLDGEGDDTEFNFAVEDELDGFGALGADDVEGDARVLLFELADEERQDVEGGGVVGADGESAARHAF